MGGRSTSSSPPCFKSLSQALAVVVLCSVLSLSFSPPHQWVRGGPSSLLLREASAGDMTAVQQQYEGGGGGEEHHHALVAGGGGVALFKQYRTDRGTAAGYDPSHHQEERRVAALHDLVTATKRLFSAFWTLISSIIPKGNKRREPPPAAPTTTTTATTTTAHAVEAASAAPEANGGLDGLVVDLTRLTPEQRHIVDLAYDELLSREPGLVRRAKATGMELNQATVARYLMVSKWDLKSVSLVEKTVRWREEERLASISPDEVRQQATTGGLYVQGRDKAGRPLIYFRPAPLDFSNPDSAVRYLIYTLDRALRDARHRELDAYSLIIDIQGLSFHNMPPVKAIKAVFHLLRFHYPMRVGFIAIVNAGQAFMLLWKVLWGLVCPHTREKITILSRKEQAAQLLQRVDEKHLQVAYGGQNAEAFDVERYLAALA